MKQLMILFSFMTLAFSTTAAPAIFEAQPGKASFEAIGRPSLLKIKGNSGVPRGQMTLDAGTTVAGNFEVTLTDIDTGIELRNSHLKENYLKVAEHPTAKLKIESVDFSKGWTPGQDAKDRTFRGQLTLKGKTRPIEGKVSVHGAAMATEANFTISLNDFDIGVPKYMGITVADTVNVRIEIPGFERK